jgi:hypothetical protein
VIIKERIQKLIKDDFYINHKSLGRTQMQKELDYVRIYDKAKQYSAIQIIDISENMISIIDKKLLHSYMIKEEVWVIGGDIALDLYI